MAKVVASIALASIVIGIIGTGILVIANSLSSSEQQEISADKIQEYLDSLSWSSLSWWVTSTPVENF